MTKTPRLAVPQQWRWSSAVARSFDSHVREQLPWYELATGIVSQIARAYVPQGGVVVDVGASTGNVGRALASLLDARNAWFFAVDSSDEMMKVYEGPGTFVCRSAETFDFQEHKPDLIVCFLSLMFVPVRLRLRLIERMQAAVNAGGALIVFDKMVPRPGYVGTVAYRLTLAAKQDAGASPAEIVAKELSISGIQRPLQESELAGFVEVFRFGDFAGFVWERT